MYTGQTGVYRPRYDAIQVDQWNMTLHACPHADVVAMLRVGASVAISNQTISAKFIFIWARLAFDDRSSPKTQRQIEQRRFDDTVWRNKRDASTFNLKATQRTE